jgi:glutathione S-transferase
VIVLHHLNNSRSQRVLWMLEELGLPYDVRFYQRDAKTMLAPPELRAVHPLGKSPVIEDGARVLAESGAIVQYLAETYGRDRLIPVQGTDEYWRYVYWMHFAEGTAMPPLLMKLVFGRMKKAPMPFFVKPVARAIAERALQWIVEPNLARHLAYMEGEIAKRQWFAGDGFSAADIQMSFPLEASQARGGLDAASAPRLSAFLERIHSRPAYQRALKRGGKYELVR